MQGLVVEGMAEVAWTIAHPSPASAAHACAQLQPAALTRPLSSAWNRLQALASTSWAKASSRRKLSCQVPWATGCHSGWARGRFLLCVQAGDGRVGIVPEPRILSPAQACGQTDVSPDCWSASPLVLPPSRPPHPY